MILKAEIKCIVSFSVKDADFAKSNVWLEVVAIRVKQPLKVGEPLTPAVLRNHVGEGWTLA